MKITKDMLIYDIIQQYPDAVNVFFSFGLGCVGCMAARGETLEQAAAVHGLDVEEMLEQLNA